VRSIPRSGIGGARAPVATSLRREWPWLGSGVAALLALLWASRSATLGVPVADDYVFLWRRANDLPIDPFGPMGEPYFQRYWRPLSRQLYYALVGPAFEHAPWVATLVAALALFALFVVLYRFARRFLAPPEAAMLACFPLLAEPARVALLWPSAAQHLLGALFAALAIERMAAGSRVASAAAALAALLSSESGAIVLPALPLVAALRERSWRAGLRATPLAFGVGALWGAGYAIALTHGVTLGEGVGASPIASAYGRAVAQTWSAHMNVEDLAPRFAQPLTWLVAALLGAGVLAAFAPAARRRLADGAPVLAGSAAWFVLGVAPLALLQPDWCAWRSLVPALGLAFVLAGGLALVARPLAIALVALRLAALLLATPAPAIVEAQPAASTSSLSFARLARMQRTVESTRRALRAEAPTLPRGAIVRYWNVPRVSELGFAGERALQTWYADTSLAWGSFAGAEGLRTGADAVVEYERDAAWPAVVLAPHALALYAEGYEVSRTLGLAASESLLVAALAAQSAPAPAFRGALHGNLAWIAYANRAYARADSLNRSSLALVGESAGYWALAGFLALARGDQAAASEAVARSLTYDANDARALALARMIESPNMPSGR